MNAFSRYLGVSLLAIHILSLIDGFPGIMLVSDHDAFCYQADPEWQVGVLAGREFFEPAIQGVCACADGKVGL